MNVKFVVFSYPRTGSSLLCDSLNNHHDLIVADEILNVEKVIKWKTLKFKEIYGSESLERDGAHYLPKYDLSLLIDHVYEEFNGFKVIYDQVELDWNFCKKLRETVGLKFIFLTRNLLDSAASYLLAKSTNKWQVKPGETYTDQSLTIDSHWLNWYFSYYSKCHNDFLSYYCHSPHLIIDYKSITKNWTFTIKKVQQFLGVSLMNLPMVYGKRTLVEPIQLITNYNSLAKTFVSTPYEHCFHSNIPML